MDRTDRMNIVMCYSPDWREHVRVEIFAIQQTNPGAHVYLLSDEDGRLEMPGCTFVDVSGIFKSLIPSQINVDTRFTKYALYRLLIPTVVQEARVIYIDADAIVNGSLKRLWGALNCGNNEPLWMVGVPDIGVSSDHKVAIGMDAADPYVNAGVTMLDLDAIRINGKHYEWLDLVNDQHFWCHDQDILNLTLRGHVGVVDCEYNSSRSTGHHSTPKVAHFAGPAFDKPWYSPDTLRRVRHADIWWAWRRRHDAAMAHGYTR